MIVKPTRAQDFYKGIVNIYFRRPLTAPAEEFEGAVYSYLRGVWRQFQMVAMAALDLGFGLESARCALAESAGAYLELQRRTRKSSSPEPLQTVFRIGTCGDVDTAGVFAARYLETPEGKRGETSSRMMAPTPEPDDHWWHLANALALFHTGDHAGLAAAMDELVALPPRRHFAHSAEWWREMVRLAVHCLISPRPDPFEHLVVIAAVNQKMFAGDERDFFYEAWFAEIAMSFASAAVARGWSSPAEDPHPSMPLGLLSLPPMPVPHQTWGVVAAVDPELRKAIERAAKGSKSGVNVGTKTRRS